MAFKSIFFKSVKDHEGMITMKTTANDKYYRLNYFRVCQLREKFTAIVTVFSFTSEGIAYNPCSCSPTYNVGLQIKCYNVFNLMSVFTTKQRIFAPVILNLNLSLVIWID